MFPTNQLLDYLPDTNADWVYNSKEWNSTYLPNCKITPRTSVQLNVTGVHTKGLLWLYHEIPGLWSILSPRFRRNDIVQNYFYGGVRNPEKGVWDDVIIWQYADLSSSKVSNELNASTQQTTISLAAIYMKNAPEYNLSTSDIESDDWAFGIGEVPQAYYSKVECDIKRNRQVDGNFWEAYPQIRTNCDLAKELDVYWSAGAIQPADGSGDKMTISLPSGENLLRFYQSWMIAKDTFYPFPSTKEISVRKPTVELSIVFIVICGLVLLIVLLGLLHWGMVKWGYRKILPKIPETKVDWILQSILEAQGMTSSEAALLTHDEDDSKNGHCPEPVMRRKELWRSATYVIQHETTGPKIFGKVQAASRVTRPEKPQGTNANDGKDQGPESSISPILKSSISPSTAGTHGHGQQLPIVEAEVTINPKDA